MRSRRFPLVLALLATTAYALVGRLVFSGRPLHVDEISQAFQARIFTGGHLWQPTADPPEFFSALLIVNRDGRTFAQFPPGWPLHLALGYLMHMPWLIAPLCGGLALLAFDQMLRVTGEDDATRVAALVLFAISPWVVFNSASWMNHVPTTMWLLAALALGFSAQRKERWKAGLLTAAGAAFGLAFTIRPVDALAFLVPIGVWLGVALLRRQFTWIQAAGFLLGLAIPIGGFLAFNAATTGHPLMLGYEAQWGTAHRLGFHAAPWGPPHTVARGWRLISGYYRELQWVMYESPVSALIAPAVGLLLYRRWKPLDAVLLGGVVLLSVAYFAYWFEADYLGPRYLFPIAPLVALWTARLPSSLIARGAPRWLAAVAACLIAANVAAGGILGVPRRWQSYARYAPARRWDVDSALASAGIRDGIILVREAWSAQVTARLAGRGVPRAMAERLVESTDLCMLDLQTALLERDDRRWPEVEPVLSRLMRDSADLVPTTRSPDPNAKMLPRFSYPTRCEVRAREDRLGTVPLVPLLLASQGGNLFARDLHELTPRLLERQLGRPVFLLSLRRDPSGTTVRSFEPFFTDSAERDWRAATPH